MTPAELITLLSQPEGQELEFKSGRILGSPESLAGVIASFANASGGTVLIGVRDSPRGGAEPDGVGSIDSALTSVDRAIGLVSPRIAVARDVVRVDGKAVVALGVPAGADGPYLGAGSATVRHGTRTRPVDLSLLLARPHDGQRATMDRVSTALAEQTKVIEDLRSDLVKQTGAKMQLAFGAVFFFLSTVVAILLDVLH